MEKVLPRGLNYSDIKPEAIENMIRVVRFTPTATVNNAKPNDIIRFMLTGNGFYDPYSAYIKMDVSVPMTKFELGATATSQKNFIGQFLDRSAHSIISRLVVKSQGTELERIDQYDVMCAMINDMLYSQEQSGLHHIEGMPTESLNTNNEILNALKASSVYNPAIVTRMINPVNMSGQWNYLGDQGFFKYRAVKAEEEKFSSYVNSKYLDYAPATGAAPLFLKADAASLKTYSDSVDGATYASPAKQTWCIPIYSGILGVLQPDKKLLPLSLMPLEVEFTVNPYAFYTVGPEDTATDSDPRNYQVDKFWIYSHVLFFEQELHRSLESVVAENGIFIHFNSFYLAPIATHQGQSLSQYAQINIHAKSINSVHFVFIYRGFEPVNGARKLHFVNHNLNQLQLRNGTELTPSDSIQGEQGAEKASGAHGQFLIETFKAYNKLHDPTTDAAITAFNYCTDQLIAKPTVALDMLAQQARLGRCQYGISLQGEEIGQDQTIISGRKGLMPFDINMGSLGKAHAADSYQIIFIKADYIIYVRPDLVVTILGR